MSTYWRRVRYSSDEPPWQLREEVGRGLVAYATRDFSMGEQICVEFPVVWVHGHHPFTEDQLVEIHEKVEALNDEDKAALYAMANVFSEEEHPAAVGIFMTNSFDMTDSIYGKSCAMYLALARLNHSCTPNAQQSHLPDTTEEVLYASRDIKKGEEINDCYIDLRNTREKRRKELLEWYRFHCNCAACSVSEDAIVADDDERRLLTAGAVDEAIHLVNEGQIEDAENLLVESIEILTNSPYLNFSVRYLPEILLALYQMLFSQRNFKKAAKYLKQAHHLNITLSGERSPESKDTAEKLHAIKCMLPKTKTTPKDNNNNKSKSSKQG